MKLSKLEPAHDIHVERYLIEKLQLNKYQAECMKNSEIIRFSKYKFYQEAERKKVSFLWRLTIFLFIIYLPCLNLFAAFKWMATGSSTLGRKYLDGFHYKWVRKIGLS